MRSDDNFDLKRAAVDFLNQPAVLKMPTSLGRIQVFFPAGTVSSLDVQALLVQAFGEARLPTGSFISSGNTDSVILSGDAARMLVGEGANLPGYQTEQARAASRINSR